MDIKKSDKYWYFGTMLLSIVTAGSLNSYHFFEGINIQLHDTFVIVITWKIAVLIFVPTSFLVFLILSIRSKFLHLGTTGILLVQNTLTIGMTLYLFYLSYVMMTEDALAELFRNTKSENLMMEQLNNIIVFFSLLITLLIIGEYLLIRRIKALRK